MFFIQRKLYMVLMFTCVKFVSLLIPCIKMISLYHFSRYGPTPYPALRMSASQP